MKSRLVSVKLLSGRLVPALGILLAAFFLAGCQYWFQDMKGYLEHWTGTVQVSGVQWFSTPESQKDDNGADTIPTNAEISFHASIENPDGYEFDVGIGREQDNLRSIRIAGESGALVLPLATVEDSTSTSISLAIDSISSVTTLASLALEHTDFTVTFVPTRTDSGQGTPTARTLTLRYNTPPRMPLEVAWSAGEGKLSWLGAEHSKGWEMVQGVDQSLDNHIYWAWPKGITDPTNPDSVARFQVYVDGVLSQEGSPHQFEYNDYSQVSPKLADYQVYRVAVSSGTRVEVYALDVEGVRSLGTGSGIAPHKTTLDASGGFFASSGTSGVELYKAHGSRASGGDLETPYYDGHYLSGWSTSAGGNPVTFPYSIEAPVTLYALWTAYPASGGDVGGDVSDGGASGGKPPVTTYAITYNGNGATSGTEPAGQTKLVGKSVVLATNSGGLVRDGYTFDGWNTQADGQGTVYAEGSSYSADASVILYAKWIAVDYSITYELDGGTNNSANPQGYTVAELPLSLAAPSKTGYTFDGWLKDGQKVTKIAEGTTGNLILTAKWSYEEPEKGADGKYEVSNHGNLLWIGQELSAGRITKFDLKLTADIVIPSGEWVPINTDGSTFDGQGHSITLTNASSGLFTNCNYATIENLVLKGNITGNSVGGALMKYAYCTVIRNVMSLVDITDTSTNATGGLVGGFGGSDDNGQVTTIENCAVYADISSAGAVGGLVGKLWNGNQYGKILNSVYMGGVTGNKAGAVVGYNDSNQGSPSTLDNIYYCVTNNSSIAVIGDTGAGGTVVTNVVSKNGSEIASVEAANLLNTGLQTPQWEFKSGEKYPTLKKNP